MRRSSWIVLLAAVMSWPATALAKDAVVPPLLSKGVDPLVVLNLTSLIASELDFQGGFGNVTQLDATPGTMNSACLTSASCLGGIASNNKAEVLVGGTVTLVSTKYEFNLVYVDAGKIVRTKKFTLPNTPSVIADAMGGYVKELVTGKSMAAEAEENSMGDMDTVSSLDLLDDEGSDDVFSGGGSNGRQVSPPKSAGRSLEDVTSEEDEEDARAAAAAAEAKKKAAAAAAAAEAKRVADEEARARAAEAKRVADEEARARAAAAKRAADEEARARAAAEAKRAAAAVNTDDIDFAPAGEIKVEEIQLGSAAGMIQLGGDDEEEEDEYTPPPRATSARPPVEDEYDAPPARPSTSRAPTSRAPTSRPAVEEDPEPTPSRGSSSRSSYADLDEEEEDDSTSRSRSSGSGSDYEDLDTPESTSRSRSSTPTRSSTGSSSSSSASRSRDYDELDEDRGSGRGYDEDSLDLDRGSKTTGKAAKDDSKVGVTARVGYAGFQGLNFLTYGGELVFSPKPHLALAVGFDAASAKRVVPDALQAIGYPPTTWNTILPIHMGLQGRFGEGSAKPYLGADLVVIPGAVQAAEDGSGGGGAVGGRGRVGLDLLLADNFGLNFEAAAGVWSGNGFVTVEKDMGTKGFVPQISAGTVLRF